MVVMQGSGQGPVTAIVRTVSSCHPLLFAGYFFMVVVQGSANETGLFVSELRQMA